MLANTAALLMFSCRSCLAADVADARQIESLTGHGRPLTNGFAIIHNLLRRRVRLLSENKAAHGGRDVGGWCHVLLPGTDRAFHAFLSVQALVSTAVFEQASQHGQIRNALAMFQGDFGELVEVDGNHAGFFAVVDHRRRRQRFQVVKYLPELVHFLRIGGDRCLALVGCFQNVFAAGLDHVVWDRNDKLQTVQQGQHHAVVLDDPIGCQVTGRPKFGTVLGIQLREALEHLLFGAHCLHHEVADVFQFGLDDRISGFATRVGDHRLEKRQPEDTADDRFTSVTFAGN